MNKVHYNVSGLLNEKMKTQVKNVLNKVEGVSSINVDLVRGTIEVGYNDPADAKEITDGIERVGCKIEG
ncbi:heavy-metal-associated domain-containing protein [Anaerocolumna sp. MB42-C2]|uniref:heavy-metal-associated domain-containing protein n=1 Tax=Anaerocolumna sp. MB42-C2 TaxID=3070997 RepID=UPI0027DF0B8D|nr:heavy metal-associated domain-containing protein [Anaerocolumna sp. MB42-C2]WMJ88808.1 heavy metal-associated domain-containing protein [Anaerocolumna sp. MB42-C2]